MRRLRRLPWVSPPTGDGTPAFSGESYPAIRSGAGKTARGALLQQAVALELGTHDVARQPEALRCPHLVRTEASLGARRCNCRCTFSERASQATSDFVQQVFDSCAPGKASNLA